MTLHETLSCFLLPHAIFSVCAMNFKLLVPVLLALAVPLAVKRAQIPQHLLGHIALHQGSWRAGRIQWDGDDRMMLEHVGIGWNNRLCISLYLIYKASLLIHVEKRPFLTPEALIDAESGRKLNEILRQMGSDEKL